MEHPSEKQTELTTTYQEYLNGTHQLLRYEAQQVGFRLAKEIGHQRIYAVDWNKAPPVEETTIDVEAFAKENDPASWAEILATAQSSRVKKEERSVIEIYKSLNQEESIRKSHQLYFAIAQIGREDQYIGADWVQYWYGRNLKIFVNLTRITESDGDRIVVIIGAGHIRLLEQIATDADYYILESPLRYLAETEGVI